MTETKEMSLFPRAEGEYAISEKMMEDEINRALSNRFNVDFPLSPSKPRLSTRLGVYPINPDLKELLITRGFSFGSGMGLNKEMSFGGRNDGSGHWSFMREFRIELFVEWQRTISGVTLTINSVGYIIGRKQNRVCDHVLVSCIRDYGYEIHPLMRDLLLNNGEMQLSWQHLGLERIVPILFTFKKEYLEQCFSESLSTTVKHIAMCEELSPFDPNPFALEGHGSTCTTLKFVPESARTLLLARWDEQYRNFISSLRRE